MLVCWFDVRVFPEGVRLFSFALTKRAGFSLTGYVARLSFVIEQWKYNTDSPRASQLLWNAFRTNDLDIVSVFWMIPGLYGVVLNISYVLSKQIPVFVDKLPAMEQCDISLVLIISTNCSMFSLYQFYHHFSFHRHKDHLVTKSDSFFQTKNR